MCVFTKHAETKRGAAHKTPLAPGAGTAPETAAESISEAPSVAERSAKQTRGSTQRQRAARAKSTVLASCDQKGRLEVCSATHWRSIGDIAMADFDLALKRPGLGILLLNGSALGLLQASLSIFTASEGLWTRLAIVCFGIGAVIGVLELFAEGVLPPKTRFENKDAFFHRMRSIKIYERGFYLSVAISGALIVWSIRANSGLLSIVGFAYFAAAIITVFLIGERLREWNVELDDKHAPPPEFIYEFDTSNLFLHRALLAISLGFFTLGVIAAVNQPFSKAVKNLDDGVAVGPGYPSASPSARVPGENGRPNSPQNNGKDQQVERQPDKQPRNVGTVRTEYGNISTVRNDYGGNVTMTTDGSNARLSAPAGLLFAFDSSELEPNAPEILRTMAEAIRRAWRSGAVEVVGHTDSIGPRSYNLELSRARAQTVANWLATRGGLNHVPFDIRGKGADEPIESNARPEGRQLNRRVVIVVPR